MKLSKFNIKKINIKDVDNNYIGQDILLKLGELYQFESGIYGYGNIWTKLERIVENIIIDELDKADCIQVEFPKLQPRKIWDQSNRWNTYTKDGDIMFTLDNNLGEYGLAPTAEECATIFGANRLLSYKQLPTTYYQISEKFRKEIRTRGYLFRPRTFVMMDAYSFDKSEEDMVKTYNKMHTVYQNIFKRLGINIYTTISDNGTMGGKVSEEYQAITKLGEDIILYNENNNKAINKEVINDDNKDIYLNKLEVNNIDDLKSANSVELGNNFQLGTTYSNSMNLYFKDEYGNDKPYYMGCYGIGLGRIIATIIENNIIKDKDKIKGFSIPYSLAPYKVQIIYKEDKEREAKKIYNYLLENSINCILDDRDGYSLGNKINDVYTLGTPYMIVIGNKFDGTNIEIEETKSGIKEIINIDNLKEFLDKKSM